MNYKRITYLLLGLFITAAVGTVSAQTRSSEEESPFKNDPFFASPINELLNRPSDSITSQADANKPKEVRRYFQQLSESGIDSRGALEAGPYRSSPLYSAYPNLPMIHFNRVNSLFLGIRKERMQWFPHDNILGLENIHPHGMIGYSFGQKEWHYTVGLEKLIGRQRHVMVGAEYHKASATDDHWRVGLTETTLTSFAAGYDFLDYYKQQGWGTYLLVRSDRFFEGGIAYSNDRFSTLDRSTNFALFGSGHRYRINPPIDISGGIPVSDADISSITFSASFNPKRLVLSRYYTFSLQTVWERAGSAISESEYAYDKYYAEMVNYFNFEPGGMFKHRLIAGGITGDPPLFRMYELGGIGSMRALPYKSMTAANEMLLSNAEVHFGRPGRSAGTEWIDFDDFYLSLFLDSGWTRYNEHQVDGRGPFSGFNSFSLKDLKHNAGFGVGSSLIRCELAWDLNNTSRAPVLWLRLNPTF